MAQSRSKKEAALKGEKQAAEARSKMSTKDQFIVEHQPDTIVGHSGPLKERSDTIKRTKALAGSPGAFQTKPGGDIKNSRKKKK